MKMPAFHLQVIMLVMKHKAKRRIRPLRILILLILITGIPAAFIVLHTYLPVYRSMKLKTQKKAWEYGDGAVQTMSLVKNADDFDDITADPKSFSLHEAGWHTITYTCRKDNVRRNFRVKYNVNDSQRPLITFRNERVWVAQGDNFDATDNIASVTDPIDGDLEYRKKEPSLPKERNQKVYDKGWYTVHSNADTGKPGTYQAYVTAYDQNGNEADLSYRVEVY